MATARSTYGSAKRLTVQGRRTLMTSPRAMRHAPPSGELINAVLQYADVSVDLGGGRTLYRLSERRMADPVIAGPLGREAPRLADVGVVWDEVDDEIFRVLDKGAGDALDAAPTGSSTAEEPQFELTPAALAYLADVGVVWDEVDDEIFRVLDKGAGDALDAAPTGPSTAEEPQFELTPAALAYLAASGGRA